MKLRVLLYENGMGWEVWELDPQPARDYMFPTSWDTQIGQYPEFIEAFKLACELTALHKSTYVS